MVSRTHNPKVVVRILFLVTLLLLLFACQAPADPATPSPTDTAVAQVQSATPTLAPTEVVEPTEETADPEPSPTSPVSTPTPPLTQTPQPTPSPSPTPVPDPTFHTIVSGDSLIGIAGTYQVSLGDLLYANGYTSQDEVVLTIGNQIQIPLCEAYQVASGNTLSGIAGMCNVTLDDLLSANIGALAPLGTVDSVPVGFVLIIPPPGNVNALPACTAQPAREQVIEYTPAPGEGINCLAQIFGLSTTTILQANVLRLTGSNVYGSTPLLIPPSNGAILEITEADIESGVTLADIADWYAIPTQSILDWNGNPVSDPLTEGQQLFIPGANLLFGRFQSTPAVTPTPDPGEISIDATSPAY